LLPLFDPHHPVPIFDNADQNACHTEYQRYLPFHRARNGFIDEKRYEPHSDDGSKNRKAPLGWQHAVYQLRPLRRPWSVRIYAAFDLGQPLLMSENHGRDGNCTTDDDGHDRHQQTTQAHQGIHKPVHLSRLRFGRGIVSQPPEFWWS
jgi:hypothetical protein